MAMRFPILIASSMSWVTKMTGLRSSRCRRRNSACRPARRVGGVPVVVSDGGVDLFLGRGLAGAGGPHQQADAAGGDAKGQVAPRRLGVVPVAFGGAVEGDLGRLAGQAGLVSHVSGSIPGAALPTATPGRGGPRARSRGPGPPP